MEICVLMAYPYISGIPYLQIPTTLLARVDSFANPAGKKFKRGFAGILKCGVLDDPERLKTLEPGVGAIGKRNMDF